MLLIYVIDISESFLIFFVEHHAYYPLDVALVLTFNFICIAIYLACHFLMNLLTLNFLFQALLVWKLSSFLLLLELFVYLNLTYAGLHMHCNLLIVRYLSCSYFSGHGCLGAGNLLLSGSITTERKMNCPSERSIFS